MGTAWVVQLPTAPRRSAPTPTSPGHLRGTWEGARMGRRGSSPSGGAPDYTASPSPASGSAQPTIAGNPGSPTPITRRRRRARCATCRFAHRLRRGDLCRLFRPARQAAEALTAGDSGGDEGGASGCPDRLSRPEHVRSAPTSPSPEPRRSGGAITAMTSFFPPLGRRGGDRQFISTASGAGGSSGSAMFNDKVRSSGCTIRAIVFIQTGPSENDHERVPSGGSIN